MSGAFTTLSRVMYGLLVSLGLLALESHAAAQAVTVEKIFKVWKARQERTRSGRFEWNEERTWTRGSLPLLSVKPGRSDVFPLEDVKTTCKIKLSFDRERMKLNITGPQWLPAVHDFVDQEYISVFDGRNTKSFFRKAGEEVHPLGFIFAKRKANPDADSTGLYPICFTFLPFHPAVMEGKFRPPRQWRVSRSPGNIDGRSFVILESFLGNDRESCWVDPQRDFVVARYRLDSPERKPLLQLDISYKHDPAHGWVPIEWHSASYYKNRAKLKWSDKSTVTDYGINVAFDDKDFQLEFPTGTVVEDGPAKQRYILRDGGKKRIITDEENTRLPTYTELLQTDSGHAGLPRPRSWSWLYWIAVATFIVLLSLFGYLRRRARA